MMGYFLGHGGRGIREIFAYLKQITQTNAKGTMVAVMIGNTDMPVVGEGGHGRYMMGMFLGKIAICLQVVVHTFWAIVGQLAIVGLRA